MSTPSPQPSLLQAARALLRRDLQLLWRRRSDALQPALFALLIVVLFALGLGGRPDLLAQAAPAVLWLSVLLAGLLSLDALFRSDVEDGSIEPSSTSLRNSASSDSRPASNTDSHSTAGAACASRSGRPPRPSANSTTISSANSAGCSASLRRRHSNCRSRRSSARAACSNDGCGEGVLMLRPPG